MYIYFDIFDANLINIYIYIFKDHKIYTKRYIYICKDTRTTYVWRICIFKISHAQLHILSRNGLGVKRRAKLILYIASNYSNIIISYLQRVRISYFFIR